ncbi:carbohydrate porin [Rhodoblastus sp.]|uniref:carbohydrate porin n=1 Tax=Rhodoblastus sp. TaxID=1962975 RepID=UPI0035AEFECA
MSKSTDAQRGARASAKNWRGAAVAALVALPSAAFADDAPPPTITDQIPQLASVAAFKKQLADKGIGVAVNYIGDVFGNPSGGQKQGAAYDGRLELVLDADMEKLAGIKGGAIHANGYWITGGGLTSDYVGSLMPVTNTEAMVTVRLYELWYEQKFFDGKAAFRFGQLAADTEFLLSKYGALFVNGTFGWPAFTAANLPGGGPAYPLATPGVRLKLGSDSDPFTVLLALYNGDPAGKNCIGNPQKCNAYGTTFALDTSPLMMQEFQWRYNQDKDSKGLAGQIKIGAYEHFGDFNDERFDVNGLPIAFTGGDPGQLRGNWGIYGLWDQQILKLSDDGSKSVGFFARAMGAPDDRNLMSFYLEGGLNFAGLVPNRSDDVFGVAAAYGQISNAVRGYQFDAGIYPVQNYEAMIEVTYQAALMPGWTIQPDFQYIFHPGGNIADASGFPAKDAVVLGVRTSMAF